MDPEVRSVAGQTVLFFPPEGSLLGAADDALDVVAAAAGARARVVVVPTALLDPDFLDLSTGVAGAFLQKLANYHIDVVIAGDISRELGESKPLRDFVRECARGRQIAFVNSEAEVDGLLSGGGA